MTDALDIAIAQLNPTMGDIAGNAERVREARESAAALFELLDSRPERGFARNLAAAGGTTAGAGGARPGEGHHGS